MVGSDCIYNDIVHTFIANLVEIEGVVFPPALNTGSPTCLHTFGKRLFLCSVDRKRKLQLKYQNIFFHAVDAKMFGIQRASSNPNFIKIVEPFFIEK